MLYDIKLIREKETPKGELKQVCESYRTMQNLSPSAKQRVWRNTPTAKSYVCVAPRLSRLSMKTSVRVLITRPRLQKPQ